MKKKILALFLSVAMMVTILPFSALVSAEGTDENASDGIAGYITQVPTTGTSAGAGGRANGALHWTTGGDGQALELRHENGEHFFVVDEEITKKASGVNTQFFVKGMSTVGIPEDINISDTSAIAVRLKINDNSAVYNTQTSSFRVFLYAGKTYNIVKRDFTNTATWLDLNDGSHTKMYPSSGYSASTYDYETVGSMDGYMIMPLKLFGVDAATLKSSMDWLKFTYNEMAANSSEGRKASTWANKELLIGDIMFVNNVNDFVKSKIKTAGIGKYESEYDDGAYIASRVAGYKSSYGGSVTSYIPAKFGYSKVDPTTEQANGFIHIYTISGGDRALKYSPIGSNKVGEIEPYNIDTYDNITQTTAPVYNTYEKGVPSDITYSDIKGFAMRVAITGNEGTSVTFRPRISDSSTKNLYSDKKLEIPFIDLNGNITTYIMEASSVTGQTGITVTGNIDGYFIIPSIGSDYWSNSGITETFFESSWKGPNISLLGDWSGKAYYYGDIFWLTDVEKFKEAHTADPLKFSAASLTLENDLTLNLKIDKARYDDLYRNTVPYAMVTLGDDEAQKIEGELKNGKYVISFKDVAPQRMGDVVKATAYEPTKDTAGTPLEEMSNGKYSNYSIKSYCESTIGTTENASLKTLLVDLLNYGAAAQNYKNYKTDALVNKDVNQELASGALPTLDAEYTRTTLDGATTTWKSAALRLDDDAVTLKFKLATEANIEGMYVKVTYDNGSKSATIGAEEFVATSGGYYVYFDGLHAAQMREDVTATVYDADGNAVSGALTYSVENYAAWACKQSDEKLVNLVTAMMKYGISAENL